MTNATYYRMFRCRIVFFLVGVFAVATTLAHAQSGDDTVTYVPTVTHNSATPLRWMGSNCVIVQPSSIGSADITDGSDLVAIERAAQNWRDAVSSCSYIRFDLQEPSDTAVLGYDPHGTNTNVIAWVESGWPHDADAAGITVMYFVDKAGSDQDGRILDADIWINGEFSYATDGNPNKTDIENTVTHEMGHMLGLDHTCHDGARDPYPLDNLGDRIPLCAARFLPESVTEATMYNFADPGETKKRSLEESDIFGICDTYPLDQDPGVCAPATGLGSRGGCSMTSEASDQARRIGFGGWIVVMLFGFALAFYVLRKRFG